jgi:hypothetical protein
MLNTLRNWLAWLRDWRATNERAHQNARPAPCCSDPRGVYAARHKSKGS